MIMIHEIMKAQIKRKKKFSIWLNYGDKTTINQPAPTSWHINLTTSRQGILERGIEKRTTIYIMTAKNNDENNGEGEHAIIDNSNVLSRIFSAPWHTSSLWFAIGAFLFRQTLLKLVEGGQRLGFPPITHAIGYRNVSENCQRSKPTEEEDIDLQEQNDEMEANQNDIHDDDDDNDDNESLIENVYTLLFTAPWKSSAFWFAMGAFLLQQFILWILLKDLFDYGFWDADFEKSRLNPTDFNYNNNPFKIPPGVSIQVTIAQGIAMLLAVAVQTDLIVAITKLVGGSPTIVVVGGEDLQHQDLDHTLLSRSKWYLSSILQLSSGFILLVDLFFLLMQSDSVQDVCLDFASLTFVAEISDVAFTLALYGFVANPIQHQCKLVKYYKIEKSNKVKTNEYIFHRVIFLFHFIVLFAGFGYLVHLQWSGTFVCQTLYLQFGDSINPHVALFSGLAYQQDKRIGDRSYYIDEKGSFRIAYCDRDEIWTMSRSYEIDNEDEICDSYVGKSIETETYDVVSLPPSAWSVKNVFDINYYNATEQFVPVDTYTILCNDCNIDTCQKQNGKCIEKSVSMSVNYTTGEILSDGITSMVCQCKNGRYGINCEYASPCNDLVPDKRAESFMTVGGTWETLEDAYFENFEPTFSLSNITVKYRPLYYNDEGYIILFLGRRWGISHISVFENQIVYECLRQSNNNNVTATTLDILRVLECSKDYFETLFHPLLSEYSILYMSDPMDYLTATDDVSPNDMKWFLTPQFLPYFWDDDPGPRMLCSECNGITNTCLNFGICNSTEDGSVCDCPIGTTGSLCELAEKCTTRNGTCYNGGICNLWNGECDCLDGYRGALCQNRKPSLNITTADGK